MRHKWMAFLLSAVLLLSLTTACGNQEDNADTKPDSPVSPTENNNITGGLRPSEPSATMPGAPSTDMSPDDAGGKYPTFPNTLADANADVALDDLIATLGLSATDLKTALRDVTAVDNDADDAHTYRHKLLGQEADVSYGYNDDDMIDKVTVKAGKDRMEDWRNELSDTLGASAIDGQTDAWDYSGSRVKIEEQGDHILITIEKSDN